MKKIKFYPHVDKVLALPDVAEEKSKGNIYTSNIAKETPQIEVILVEGKGEKNNPKPSKLECCPIRKVLGY